MRALILAAGRGTRMKEMTDKIPKPLIEINGKTFIEFLLENLSKAGIDEAGIVVGYMKERIKEHLKGSSMEITFVEQEEQLGTGHAVKMVREWAGENEFIVLMGDNLYSPRDIVNICRHDSYCYVAGYEHDDPSKFGVLSVNGDLLEKIIEKPENPPSNMINTGLYKFTPDIFRALECIRKSERGEYEITDAINILCSQGKVRFVKIADYWLNLGCPEDIPKLNNMLK